MTPKDLSNRRGTGNISVPRLNRNLMKFGSSMETEKPGAGESSPKAPYAASVPRVNENLMKYGSSLETPKPGTAQQDPSPEESSSTEEQGEETAGPPSYNNSDEDSQTEGDEDT